MKMFVCGSLGPPGAMYTVVFHESQLGYYSNIISKLDSNYLTVAVTKYFILGA